MLELTKVADLDLSAASGLVALEDSLCVVADDELFLAVYGFDGQPRRKVALFPGELPEAHVARKRQKPDLEALVALPDGRLLALGSGSTPGRQRGALIDVRREFAVRAIDLEPLYRALAAEIAELNIEGAAVHAGRLWLAQRGNGALGTNACIELDLGATLDALDALDHAAALTPKLLRAIHPVALGELDGVALSLTDLCGHDRAGLLFSAAAEASDSTYDDGVCAGSVVGALSTHGEVQACIRVNPGCKIEGIALASAPAPGVTAGAPGVALFLVADPDDRSQRAPLYRAVLEL